MPLAILDLESFAKAPINPSNTETKSESIATSNVNNIPSKIIGRYPCKSSIIYVGDKRMPRNFAIPWQSENFFTKVSMSNKKIFFLVNIKGKVFTINSMINSICANDLNC